MKIEGRQLGKFSSSYFSGERDSNLHSEAFHHVLSAHNCKNQSFFDAVFYRGYDLSTYFFMKIERVLVLPMIYLPDKFHEIPLAYSSVFLLSDKQTRQANRHESAQVEEKFKLLTLHS